MRPTDTEIQRAFATRPLSDAELAAIDTDDHQPRPSVKGHPQLPNDTLRLLVLEQARQRLEDAVADYLSAVSDLPPDVRMAMADAVTSIMEARVAEAFRARSDVTSLFLQSAWMPPGAALLRRFGPKPAADCIARN